MHPLKYIKNPNCPDSKVKHILIGKKYLDEYKSFFNEYDITPIVVEDNIGLPESLCGHVDLSVFHAGDNTLFVSEYIQESISAKLNETTGLRFKIIKANNQSNTYPYDCNLNVYYDGNNLIYNNQTADKSIVNCLTNSNIKKITVNQGYTNCSICTVNQSSIITGDPGIAAVSISNGIDVLLIDDSSISLKGYDHGFIGGSTFKLSNTEIAFTGFIPDRSVQLQIEYFLNKKNIRAVYMTKNRIKDIGGIISVTCC